MEHGDRHAVKRGDWASMAQRTRSEQHRVQAGQRRKAWIHKRIKSSLDNENEGDAREPVDLQTLNEAIRDIQAHSTSKNLAGLTQLRNILCRWDAPFEDIIKRHAVTHLCERLHHPDDDVKAEASWCLVNLSAATEEYARTVLKAVPALITFLEATSIRLNEHACWCLGNLAGELDEQFSKVLVGNGVVLPLLNLIERLTQHARTSTCYEVAWWCLGNLARHLRSSPWVAEYKAGDVLLEAACSSGSAVQSDAWWAISSAVAEENHNCESLLEQGILSAMTIVLSDQHADRQVLLPAVRTLGHLSAGPLLAIATSEAFSLLELVLELLVRLEESALLKEGAWAMNNLTATCISARALVLPKIRAVAQRLLSSTRLELQKEGVFALANVADVPEFATLLAQDPGMTETVLDLLVINDHDIRTAALFVLCNCPVSQIQRDNEVIRRRIEHIRSLIDLDTGSRTHALIFDTLQSLTG